MKLAKPLKAHPLASYKVLSHYVRHEKVKTGQVEPSEYAYLSKLIESEPDNKSRRAMIETVNKQVSLETIINLIQ